MAEQMRMPSGSGGLVRYFDEYHSKIQIKPEGVVIMIIGVIVLVLAFKLIFHL
ncbi:MAG: preprotein translocase subunit Sec61beta [Candidatus Paceibacterota bacterium]